jgi:hypothetical protein
MKTGRLLLVAATMCGALSLVGCAALGSGLGVGMILLALSGLAVACSRASASPPAPEVRPDPPPAPTAAQEPPAPRADGSQVTTPPEPRPAAVPGGAFTPAKGSRVKSKLTDAELAKCRMMRAVPEWCE